MSVHIISKFDEDQIKSDSNPDNIFAILWLTEIKWQVTLMWKVRPDPKSNFMAGLISCKSDEDSIKN